MSKKQATAKVKPKQEEKAKKPVTGKTATGRKASSGRAAQPAKRTGAKQATPKKETPPARTSTGKQNQATKKPAAKPTTGKKASSGRVEQPTKRTVAKQATPKKETQAKKTPSARTSTGKQNQATNKKPTAKPATGKKPTKGTTQNNGTKQKVITEISTEKKSLIQRLIAALKQRIEQKQGKKEDEKKTVFPNKFPFWARLKIEKKRTTLVIDEVMAMDKKSKKMEEHFVHRESIHPHGDGRNVKGLEKIEPNPDKTDKKPMYLKRPTKLPKKLFKPHNKDLDMPEHLKERYDKNNHKNEK